jgi:methylglyoxal synthase
MPTTVAPRKRIALIAHDNKKAELLDWAAKHRDRLFGHDLVGTGTTGRLLEDRLALPVRKLLSGPLGGDQQVGALIAETAVDVLIFFWDPLEAHPHDPDVKALIRLAVVWNIPVACNPVTADHLFSSPLMTAEYTRATPQPAAATAWPRPAVMS